MRLRRGAPVALDDSIAELRRGAPMARHMRLRRVAPSALDKRLRRGAPAALDTCMLLGIRKGTLWPIFMVLRFQMAEIFAKNPFKPKWAAYAFSYPYAFS